MQTQAAWLLSNRTVRGRSKEPEVGNTWRLGALGFDQSILGGSKDRNKDPGNKRVPARGSKQVPARDSKRVPARGSKLGPVLHSKPADNNRHAIRTDPRLHWMLP
jgi:hypothetical protein